MKSYSVTRRYNFFSYLVLILLTIATLLLTLYLVIVKDLDLGEVFFRVAWALSPALIAWYANLSEFRTIVIQDNGLITFQGPIRKRTIALSDIESIESLFFRQTIIIKYAAGRIRVPRVMEGLDDFVNEVKSMNPNIEASV